MQLRAPLVLASRSPRRKRLLESLGLRFTVQASGIEETAPSDLTPDALVEHLAQAKAEAVAPAHPGALVLAADTVVVLDKAVLGQPADAGEARAMLRRLSGRTHTVCTGLTLVHAASERRATTHEATRVTFAALTDAEIDAYVATGAPLGKAGAYGIQNGGALFIERIEGDYYNVVGLPLRRLYVLLRGSFDDLLQR